MHPLEHVVLYSDLVLFLIIPSAPLHMVFATMHHTAGAPMSHTGYDALKLPGGRRLEFGDFHHQLHHRLIECNYGGLESPLDDWIGSLHDGTADGDRLIAQRRSALAAARTGSR
jgi:sterol desaturase/sphingolipid hydroxylase (fatty acid hydroxylase superfamily)